MARRCEMNPRVTLLGVGIMGAGMAERLVEKGFAVDVWDRTPAVASRLADHGATAHAGARASDPRSDIRRVGSACALARRGRPGDTYEARPQYLACLRGRSRGGDKRDRAPAGSPIRGTARGREWRAVGLGERARAAREDGVVRLFAAVPAGVGAKRSRPRGGCDRTRGRTGSERDRRAVAWSGRPGIRAP